MRDKYEIQVLQRVGVSVFVFELWNSLVKQTGVKLFCEIEKSKGTLKK